MSTLSANMTNQTFKKANTNINITTSNISSKIIDNTLVVGFVVTLGFIISKIVTYNQTTNLGAHTKADYILMLTSCTLGIIATNLPKVLNKFLKIEISNGMRIMFSLFLFSSIFLGEVMSFYYTVPHWDDLLHFGSSIMTGMFGCVLIAKFFKTETNIKPVGIAIFAFCFAVCVGGVWEIFEFLMDGLLGLNMQKTMLQSGEMLNGYTAVADTMKDIIVDTCGATVAATIAYLKK